MNTFYLETVASGEWEDVQALFNCIKTDKSIALNKDCVNEKDRDALRIAIDNEDLAMLKLLLNHKVKLFHVLPSFFSQLESIHCF